MNRNPTNLRGKPGPGRPKGSVSAYTITDLMERLKAVEKSVREQTGKPYDFIEHCIQDAVKGDERLRLAILDRICPIPKQDLNLLGGEGCQINFVFSTPKPNNENTNG